MLQDLHSYFFSLPWPNACQAATSGRKPRWLTVWGDRVHPGPGSKRHGGGSTRQLLVHISLDKKKKQEIWVLVINWISSLPSPFFKQGPNNVLIPHIMRVSFSVNQYLHRHTCRCALLMCGCFLTQPGWHLEFIIIINATLYRWSALGSKCACCACG